MTIFKEVVFGKSKVLLNVHHHFRGELDWARIQAVMRELKLIQREMVTNRILEVLSCTFHFIFQII